MGKIFKSPIPQFNPNKVKVGPGKIIPNVTPGGDKDIETVPYVISFEFYRVDKCQIRLLEQSQARKALETLRKAGQCLNRKDLLDNNIRLEKIPDGEEYEKYYTQLTPDVELYHCNLGKEQRMFYFIEDTSKKFNVVALRNEHDN